MILPAEEIDAVRRVLASLHRDNPSRRWTKVVAELCKQLLVSDTVAIEYIEAMIGRGVEISASGRMVSLCFDLPQMSPGEAEWRQTVMTYANQGGDVLEALFALWPAISDWPVTQYGSLISELLWLRRQPPAPTLYLSSAAGSLAASKLLSALPKTALRALGIAVDSLPAAPVCFLIAGAAHPEAVVLVENQNAFERAVGATTDLPVAWISAYGFGASALDVGERLIDGLESPTTISAVRAGSPPPLQALLNHPSIFLWGDLDIAGFQIFIRARARLPALQLSGIYAPMLAHLEAGGGHPYVSLTGKAGQDTNFISSDSLIAPLIDRCRSRAVDQEWVRAEDIRNHSLYPLGAPD